ncbi:uracil-DNA glycosylase, mitochondrial [Salvia miltiorrhiza]|uniref:uracil-DNA glycosylase, mitochondrial n=1 Tax=Salvia miltiorrhiza TaxID=226208 RepID=UPI0025AD2CEA|nr:uracil-DNA glycosylase, mitochondrial [Salvia miltiorrhiza]
MAAPGKTLIDFFQQPAAKRLKRVSPPPHKDDAAAASSMSTMSISPEQKRRMEYNKALALSKRNLKLCSDKLSKAVATGVGYVKLEELLVEQTWSEVLSGELQKPYARKLCEFVETEICGSTPIYPPQHLIFNALNTTPFDCVKAVIIGQDPYHGPGQAMGLSFSVPEGIKVPSSLQNIYKELQKDMGCTIPSNGNLEKWAIQGVLLLNAVLTVRQHQANSHAKKGWEQFTDAVIGAISQKRRGVVFILWGNYAQAKSRLIDESKHYILKSAHPSGLSANRGFFGCRHFSRTNQILEKMGVSPIDWQL